MKDGYNANATSRLMRNAELQKAYLEEAEKQNKKLKGEIIIQALKQNKKLKKEIIIQALITIGLGILVYLGVMIKVML